MTTRTTRPYQTRIIRETRKFFAAGIRRVLIQLPTGAGKTHIALGHAAQDTSKGHGADPSQTHRHRCVRVVASRAYIH